MRYIICTRMLPDKSLIKSIFSYKSVGANGEFFKPRFFDSFTNKFIDLKEVKLSNILSCVAIDNDEERHRFVLNGKIFSADNDEDAILIFEVDDG